MKDRITRWLTSLQDWWGAREHECPLQRWEHLCMSGGSSPDQIMDDRGQGLAGIDVPCGWGFLSAVFPSLSPVLRTWTSTRRKLTEYLVKVRNNE